MELYTGAMKGVTILAHQTFSLSASSAGSATVTTMQVPSVVTKNNFDLAQAVTVPR